MCQTKKRKRDRVPNILSWSRLVLSVVCVVLGIWAREVPAIYWVVVGIFTLGALTDTLDGKLARKFGAESKHGEFIDSLADMVFLLAIFVFLFFQADYVGYHMNLVSPAFAIVFYVLVGVLASMRTATILILKLKFKVSSGMHTTFSRAGMPILLLGLWVSIIYHGLYLHGNVGSPSFAWRLGMILMFLIPAAFILLSISEEIAILVHDDFFISNRKGFLFDPKGTGKKKQEPAEAEVLSDDKCCQDAKCTNVDKCISTDTDVDEQTSTETSGDSSASADTDDRCR